MSDHPLITPEILAAEMDKVEAARQIAWKFKPRPSQWEILRAPERFLVGFCGRRFGKTMIATRWIVEQAIQTQGMTWWVAPTYAASMRAWRQMLQYLPREYRTVYKAERRIELTAGGMVEFHSADNPDALRGEGLTAAVMDEAAYINDSVWLDVIAPMFLTTQGRVLAITTPRAKYGWAWDLFQSGVKGKPGYHSWNLPTSDNPCVPAAEIERMRETMPSESFQREVMAQPVDALNNPLAAANLVALAQLANPIPGSRYVCGVDWGRTTDFTVFVTYLDTGAGSGRMVGMDRFTGLRYRDQMERFRKFMGIWQPEVIEAEDNNMGGPLVELLTDEGWPINPFHTSAQTKEPLIRQFQLGIEQRAVELLADRELVAECVEYEEEVETSVTTFSAPDRQHDDIVIASALGWQALNGAPGGDRAGHFEGTPESFMLTDTLTPPLPKPAAQMGF